MDNIINLQKKIVPELSDLLVERYRILRQVSHDAPIGRRALAGELGLSERVLRAQVDFLKTSAQSQCAVAAHPKAKAHQTDSLAAAFGFVHGLRLFRQQ